MIMLTVKFLTFLMVLIPVISGQSVGLPVKIQAMSAPYPLMINIGSKYKNLGDWDTSAHSHLEETLWYIVPALNGDPAAVSIEPTHRMGSYIWAYPAGGRISVYIESFPAARLSGTWAEFANSVSWIMRPDVHFIGYWTFESVSSPGRFLKHASGNTGTYIFTSEATNGGGFPKAASFAVTSECLTGWTDHGDVCYHVITDNGATLEDAQTGCVNINGTGLASVPDAETNTFLTGLLSSGATGGHLIGLVELPSEGVYVWLDGAPVTYTNWSSGAPSAASTRGKLLKTGAWDGTSDTDANVAGYICQHKYQKLEAKYICSWDRNHEEAQINITIIPFAKNPVAQVWLGDDTTYNNPDCVKSSEIPLLGAANTFSFNITLATPECAVSANQDQTIYEMNITSMTSSGMFMSGDKKFSIICDFSDTSKSHSIGSSSGAQQNILDLATSSSTDSYIPSVTIQLLDAAGNPPSGGFDVFTHVKLRAVMDHTDQGLYSSLRVRKCVAFLGSISQSSQQFKFIGDNGCGTTVNQIFSPDTGFTVPIAGATAGTTMTESSVFELFAFISNGQAGNGMMFFVCDIMLCTNSSIAPCSQPCDPNDVFRRKRRQAENTDTVAPPSGQVVAFIRVGPPGTYPAPGDVISPAVNLGNGADQTRYLGGSDEGCSHLGYIIGMGVMGLILVMTLGLVFVFFGRLMQKKKEKNNKA